MGHQERNETDNRIENFIRNLGKPLPPVDPNWRYATAWEKCSETSRLMLRICAMMSSAGEKDAAAIAEEIRETIAFLQQAERSLANQLFIRKISTEEWRRNRNYPTIKQVQNWQEVELAIKDLNGESRTFVTLEKNDEILMGIGGGDTCYVVYITFDNQSFQYLVNTSVLNIPTLIQLTIGGQELFYDTSRCVNLETALKAAKTFAESGEVDESLKWEKD